MGDGSCRARTPEIFQRAPRKNATKVTPSKKIIINKKFFENSWSQAIMYNNQGQYGGQAYQTAYPQYQQHPPQPQQSYTANYGYEGYAQHQYINTTIQPVPPGEEYPQNNWAPVGGYGNTHLTQPSAQPTQSAVHFEPAPQKDQDEAVAQERKQQNAQLIKQREDYVKKARVLRRELELLRNQKQEIMSENSSQRDMELILRENDKLQDEIQTKMKAIFNVVEMLSSIIKDGSNMSDLEAQLDASPQSHHKNSAKPSHLDPSVKYNYMHYDPELHWCRMCDEFPKTAKDYLLHLQSDKHKSSVQENDVGDNTPWHKLPPEEELPTYEGAPKKRIPIRGLQFFISAPAWYCKLCDTWIGDLHCASHHLKSQAHFQNYANFVEQNPHWEIEWLKDREKAMAKSDRHGDSSDSEVSDDERKSKRGKHRSSKRSSIDSSGKDKKRKKKTKKRRKHSSDSSSSSSSSDSSSEDDDVADKSKSIRVVMRNMKVQSIMNEDLSGKWEMLERLVDEHKKKEEIQRSRDHQQKNKEEDPLINQWMTVSEPQEKERVLLDNLKDRMKQKQEIEHRKYAEMQRRQREREREERELEERKVREEQEAKERFEREKRERERQEYERIRDKDRDQVRFKTTRDKEIYRKRRSPSPESHRSPNRGDRRYRDRKVSRENGREASDHVRSRSKSTDRKYQEEPSKESSTSSSTSTAAANKKKPPGPPTTKRLPFIGRMPLFKNKKFEERPDKELKKEDYDIPRQTRFQPGNLARAFLPQPDVVCFPKLSSYPPISAPPPPPVTVNPLPPEPPKITEDKLMKAPPAPKISHKDENKELQQQQQKDAAAPNPPTTDGAEAGSGQQNPAEDLYAPADPMLGQSMMNQYYPPGLDFNMMYSQMYDFSQTPAEADSGDVGLLPPPPQPPPPPDDVPLSHMMPLQPPPLPPSDPNDDLAMLGISADDMAAQTF